METGRFAVLSAVWAVHSALLTMFALPLVAVAADETSDVAALARPTNSVEIGVQNVSESSAKFGEYNGLNKSGPYLIGNFNLRGGDSYDAYRGGGGIGRWSLTGSDLGTTSRALAGTVSNQGQWSFGVAYDELRHNITDSYQTPFTGSMGGSTFLLPSSFGVIDATHAGDAGTGTQGLTATQLASFHTEEIRTDRKTTSLNAGYSIDRRWQVQFDYNHLEQSGAKLIGAAFSPDASGNGAGENSATFMNPTNYTTDTFDVALNWVGDAAHLKASYSGSLFKDGYSSVSWSNPFVDNGLGNGLAPVGGGFPINTYATAPGNALHQLNLSGGYAFSSTTKLAGGLSYGRNTQRASFIDDPLLFPSVLPRASLDGLVVTTHADLKLTNQTTKSLTLSAGFKFNERDNRTASDTYGPFVSVAGDPWGQAVNTPVSNRKTQLELAGDFRLDKKQSLRIAYEYEAIRRWCNNSLANSFQSSDVLSVYPNYYTTSACVQSPESKEDKVVIGYRSKGIRGLGFNAGYTYARRSAEINSSYYNPMQTSAEGLPNFGFRPYFDATRTEQVVKGGLTWQINDKLSTSLNGRYLDDKYDAALGVQRSHLWSVNLDETYSYSEKGSLALNLSLQRRQRDLLSASDNAPLDAATSLWSNRLTDENDTVGISVKHNGLMGGRIDVFGDLSYSLSKSIYSTNLQNFTSVLCSTYAITCGELPAIKNEMLRLRLNATYLVNNTSKVAIGYTYWRLKSDDYYYSAYRLGSTDVTVMPTNQLAPNHSVSMIGISYIYSFK
jgi:MtrB/PioB family decaheme-associated outer membrane protein